MFAVEVLGRVLEAGGSMLELRNSRGGDGERLHDLNEEKEKQPLRCAKDD
jgi:hypothetical protein